MPTSIHSKRMSDFRLQLISNLINDPFSDFFRRGVRNGRRTQSSDGKIQRFSRNRNSYFNTFAANLDQGVLGGSSM